MFEQFLEELGLSEKEAKIYLALLEVDKATTNELAKKTGINRTTVYPVVSTLEEKGLVSEISEDKKVYYHAESPERLETYVERQRVILTEQAERLKDMVPQLKSIQREIGERPIVKFFEGRDGAISAYHEFYEMHDKSDKEGYFIYNRDLLDEVFTIEEQERFLKIRRNKLVEPISLYNKKIGEHDFKTQGKRTRIDADTYPILADITIIGDRVLLSTIKGHVSTVIMKSKDVAITLASLVKYINDTKKEM